MMGPRERAVLPTLVEAATKRYLTGEADTVPEAVRMVAGDRPVDVQGVVEQAVFEAVENERVREYFGAEGSR